MGRSGMGSSSRLERAGLPDGEGSVEPRDASSSRQPADEPPEPLDRSELEGAEHGGAVRAALRNKLDSSHALHSGDPS
jgi:hypothetical protein